MYDWLEEEIDGVKLAHPLKVKAIADAKIKTDKIDARILAHLLRADLIPEAYVPKIEMRKVKNRIQAILDRHPEVRSEFLRTELFGKQGSI